jgi:hypothetical protein
MIIKWNGYICFTFCYCNRYIGGGVGSIAGPTLTGQAPQSFGQFEHVSPIAE